MHKRLFVVLMGVFALLSPASNTMLAVLHGEAHLHESSCTSFELSHSDSHDPGDASHHPILHDRTIAKRVSPLESYFMRPVPLPVIKVELSAGAPSARTNSGTFLLHVPRTAKPRGPPAA